MTEQQVIDLITSELADNGSNEITAAVLRPVLIAMVEQINDLVGDPNDLPPNTTVIEAVNDINPDGIVVHTGANNPNTTPPSDFKVGDFYQQIISGNTIAFWQYMGDAWINLLNTP